MKGADKKGTLCLLASCFFVAFQVIFNVKDEHESGAREADSDNN